MPSPYVIGLISFLSILTEFRNKDKKDKTRTEETKHHPSNKLFVFEA